MRKYRQPGYMESEAREKREKKQAPRGPRETLGPRTPQMPGKRSVSRCAQCGTILAVTIEAFGTCPKCGFELHSCKQCAHFDVGGRFECTEPIPERIERKDARNDCEFYAIRVSVERETSPGSLRPGDARRAFENLFKK
ncbi:MAG: hypothetical protein HY656_05230 [Acidobacteria bacterium]|nr:hypothetical protein [Acidobacteriota bacterium]